MTLSKEKQAIINMPDEEIRQILLYARIVRSMEQQEKAKKENENSAYAQLRSMIGLDSVKTTIDEILALQRLYKVANLRGIKMEKPMLHMQLVGSPGTGKSEIARLIARIFKEYGISSKGTFVEATRADMIADHVGGTAIKTKEVCQQAKGGVLFLDEAYGYMEEGRSYFAEFITSLMMEMENNRDLIIIFAGYEKEMNDFMQSNPGLKSRTPYTLRFPDYTAEELLAITQFIAREKRFDIAPGAEDHLAKILEAAMKSSPNFGNARFCRNLVERAIISKATQIQYSDCLRMSDDELFTLSADHFRMNNDDSFSPSTRRIGFLD